MVAAEEDTSETAHSSAEDEPADDDLDEAPESHHYSCGLEVRCVRCVVRRVHGMA